VSYFTLRSTVTERRSNCYRNVTRAERAATHPRADRAADREQPGRHYRRGLWAAHRQSGLRLWHGRQPARQRSVAPGDDIEVVARRVLREKKRSTAFYDPIAYPRSALHATWASR